MIIRWTVNSVAALLLLMGIWWLLQQQTVQAPAQMLQVAGAANRYLATTAGTSTAKPNPTERGCHH